MEGNYFYKFIIEYFARNFNFIIARPGLQERVLLFSTNSIVILAILFLLTVIQLFLIKRIPSLNKIITSLLVICPFIIRSVFYYAYDTPFALISLIIDIGVLIYLFYKIGSIYFKCSSDDIYSKITLGLSIVCLLGTFFTFINANSIFIPAFFIYIHFIITIYILWEIWHSNFNLRSLNIINVLIVLISIIPFIPYLFYPAPPDADITTMSEILGYLYQGQSLSHVVSGVANEYFSIRYPAGFPGISFFSSMFLNIRSSETCLILWLISFSLLVINLSKLGTEFKIHPLLTAILCINPIVTGWFGIKGGQVQEILAYAIGIGMLNSLIYKRYIHSSIQLSASLLIHPIVAIPFGIVFAYETIRLLWREKYLLSLKGSIIVVLPLLYLTNLSIGKQLYISQPEIILNELNFNLFISNIIKYIKSDTMGLYWFLLIIPFSYYFKKNYKSYLLIILWLLGGCLIDGVFGNASKYWITRFQANFSIIGVWVLSAGMFLNVLREKLVKINIPKANLLTIPIILILFISTGIISFPLSTSLVFTNHSNIRMGRYIESELPNNILIANIRAPKDNSGDGDGFGFMARGNTVRNTINARMGRHQIKTGNIVSREKFQACPKEFPKLYIECIKKLNVTHILLDGRLASQFWAKQFPIEPIKKIGSTYLYRL